MLRDKDFLRGVAAIVGTVVGAGILAIPYAFSKVGFVTGVLSLIIIGFISFLVLLYMGEVALRTKETLQIVGLVGKYLGNKAKSLMLCFQVIGIYGALIAYLIGIGSTLEFLLGGNSLIWSTIFFAITFPIIYMGLRVVEKTEFFLSYIKIVLILLLCFLLIPKINLRNLTGLDLSKLLLPYGVLIFACTGYSVIPNLERILENRKEIMKDVIIYGMLICIVIYLLFALAFVGAFGQGVAEIATQSFQEQSLSILSLIATLFLLSTPYIILAWVLKDTFIFDYNLPKPIPILLACLVPFLIMLLANPSFTRMLEISGGYAGSLTYFIFCLLVKASRKKGNEKPKFVVPGGDKPLYFIIILGILGIICTTLEILK